MTKVTLLIIDPQLDFHPEGGVGKFHHSNGSLAVSGANEDSAKISNLITAHKLEIQDVIVTLDSHHRNHIAHGVFWQDQNGNCPRPFTLISNAEVIDGTWTPKDRSLLEHATMYTASLEAKGRFKLIIWPEHCLIGSVGHAVVPELHAALQDWCYQNLTTVHYVHKGQNCLTEMYSAIAADVPIPTDPGTQKDPALIARLLTADKLLVCGEALSHCVQFTVRDILLDWPVDQRHKIVLLIDASSPVGGFEAQAQSFVEEMREMGVTVTTCDHAFA